MVFEDSASTACCGVVGHVLWTDSVASIQDALDIIVGSADRIIVLECAPQDAQIVLMIAASMNMTGYHGVNYDYYQWIGSNSWLTETLLIPTPGGCDVGCINMFRQYLPVSYRVSVCVASVVWGVTTIVMMCRECLLWPQVQLGSRLRSTTG